MPLPTFMEQQCVGRPPNPAFAPSPHETPEFLPLSVSVQFPVGALPCLPWRDLADWVYAGSIVLYRYNSFHCRKVLKVICFKNFSFPWPFDSGSKILCQSHDNLGVLFDKGYGLIQSLRRSYQGGSDAIVVRILVIVLDISEYVNQLTGFGVILFHAIPRMPDYSDRLGEIYLLIGVLEGNVSAGAPAYRTCTRLLR